MSVSSDEQADLPISEYGLIGDTRSTALVSRGGSVDWLCLPHHDSPAVFLRLLDPGGGRCWIEIDGLCGTARRYLPDTNVLETTLDAGTGTLVVTDFMPVRTLPEPVREGPDCDAPGALVRLLRCVRGRVRARVRVRPTFDYAREEVTEVTPVEHGAAFRSSELTLCVAASVPVALGAGEAEATFDFGEGERGYLLLTGGTFPDQDAEALLAETVGYWRAWSCRCAYRGLFRDAVIRSALCLKLLTYAPTGAIVAAPTAGLPEEVGGSRNWDYRFTWLRDASFTVGAFLNLGHRHEASEFLRFLRCADRSEGRALRVLYSINGEGTDEQELPHLRGWRSSRPVRIGNGAADQVQYDIYGEFLSALRLYVETVGDGMPGPVRDGLPGVVTNLAGAVERCWQASDRGIWELRTAPTHQFHSKGMCWVALDSAVRLAPGLGIAPDTAERWAALRDRIWADYHERCWDERWQAYVQAYETRELDAAVLRCTLFGANDPQDPRLGATIAAIERELARGPHVYRYRMDDGLPGSEGAFFACSFWLAGNWALRGETLRARERFAELVACANDLGLLSEEVDPATGELLGNFPQGFTHMALINGLVRLERAIEQFGLR